MDFDLLQIIRNKDNYTRFKPYIKEYTLGPETKTLVEAIDLYYKSYPAIQNIDWNAFGTWLIHIKAAQLTKESIPTYQTIIDNLQSKPPSASIDDLLRHYISCDFATRIANEARDVSLGKTGADLSKISLMVQEYDKQVGRALNTSDLFVGDDVAGVVADVTAPGLDWRLGELSVSCGPLRKGDFVVVAARPETGKTTFLASEVSHMASQIPDKRPVIWVNNEERSSKVKLRIQQAALGMTLAQIKADPAKSLADYQKLMGMDNRIMVLDNDSNMNSVKALEPIFREHKPALIVFDQLDNVEGFEKEDREDMRLGALYRWARELAHEYGPVIAASQASESAEGEQWIWQHQLRGSKTDKAGQADAIITIGKLHDAARKDDRFINVPKNKLTGGVRTEEDMRHGQWEVKIKPDIARYVGHK